MRIVKTTTHDICFQVIAYYVDEGALCRRYFGSYQDSVQGAMQILEEAIKRDDSYEWVIVTDVTTIHSESVE